MQLTDYVAILRRRWWIILLTSFVAAAAAYGFSKLQTPVFRAEASYTVSPSRPDNGLSMVMQNSMNSIRDSALAPVQLDRISNQLHLDRSADWLLGEVVSMQSLPADWKMIVRVDYPNEPAAASRLANAIGENMVAIQTTKNSQIDGTDKIYVTVLNPARDLGIVKPNTKINVAAGALLGMILGLLLAFLLEALDNSLKTTQDVERYVGLPTLGAIPDLGSAKPGTPRWPNANEQLQLVTLRDPRSQAAEAYRTLRTNIQFSSLDKALHTLLVTSTAPDEGKSTTIANLAVAMAQAEQRVILVDCDLRRPSLHTIFGLANESGLTNMILAAEDAPLPLQATEVPGLHLLTSGPLPPRPADILGSRRMEQIIARLRDEADMILFDTPPVVAVTDAAVLATRVDGVLLVLQAHKTSRERARQAKQLLEKVKANIIGVVLNGAEIEQGYGYYG